MSQIPAPTLHALNENTIRIDFSPTSPSPELCQTISHLRENICTQLSIYIEDAIASYNSILVYYDFLHIPTESLLQKIRTLAKQQNQTLTKAQPDIIKIPVYYGPEAGLDIERIAHTNNIKNSDVIRKHCEKNYMVYALGFAPGFAYMGFVDPDIRTPRLPSPRRQVPKGAVGIAGAQTGVYPADSPGGWNIVGRTPTQLIDLTKPNQKPALSVGNCVHFYPVTKEMFLQLGGEL